MHAAGPRGDDTLRHRTRAHAIVIRTGSYLIAGHLHVEPGADPLESLRPSPGHGPADRCVARVLAGRLAEAPRRRDDHRQPRSRRHDRARDRRRPGRRQPPAAGSSAGSRSTSSGVAGSPSLPTCPRRYARGHVVRRLLERGPDGAISDAARAGLVARSEAEVAAAVAWVDAHEDLVASLAGDRSRDDEARASFREAQRVRELLRIRAYSIEADARGPASRRRIGTCCSRWWSAPGSAGPRTPRRRPSG